MPESIKRTVIKPYELTEPETIEKVFASKGKYGEYVGIMLTHNKILYFNKDTIGYKLFIEKPESEVVGRGLVSERKMSKGDELAGVEPHEYFVPKLL